MKVFALSDPHLALASPFVSGRPVDTYKPMQIFGEHWQDYYQRLYDNWQAVVGPQDAVLMPGDISWAMTLEETAHDFAYLGALPGQIILCKGNHDYWWQSISRVRAALPANCRALQHSSLEVGGRVVCASRGWLTPDAPDYQEANDRKIYERELLRLEMALSEGAQSGLPLVAMLHYPPVSRLGRDNQMLQLLRRFAVRLCLYGHIHGKQARHLPEGEQDGLRFVNASCDRLDFQPLLLWQED